MHTSKSLSQPLSEIIIEASLALSQILEGKSLNSDLEEFNLSAPAKHWLYETLRRYGWAENSVLMFLKIAANKKVDNELLSILMLAVVILESDRNQAMVVDQAVRAGKKLFIENPNWGGLINGVLRNYLRNINNPNTNIQNKFFADEIKYWHPQWWINILKREFLSHFENIIKAGNRHPLQTLRLNLNQVSIDEYQTKLDAEKISFQLIPNFTIWDYQNLAPKTIDIHQSYNYAIIINPPLSTTKIPNFYEGEVSLQDFSAQRALFHLDINNNQTVLDACAAPGGKVCHIAEFCQKQNWQNQIFALEKNASRAEKINENKKRLKLNFEILIGDILTPKNWQNGKSYNRIFLDAPCSGSATVSRHPDGKWQRRKSDINKFAQTQLNMLKSAWELLAPEGKLVYATCSSFVSENEAVIFQFIGELIIKKSLLKSEIHNPTADNLQKKLIFKLQEFKNCEKIPENQLNQTILELINSDFHEYGLTINNFEKIVASNFHDGHFYAVLQKL